MELQYYKPTEIEVMITKKYMENGIVRPSQLDLNTVASIFDVDFVLYDGRTFANWEDGSNRFIAVNQNLTEKEQRENFFHELGHPILHTGRQRGMAESFLEMQEEQASQFQLYAAIPYYMLEDFNDIEFRDVYIQSISEAFVLPTYLVRKRLEIMERKIMIEKYDQEYVRRCKPVRIETEYSEETKQVLKLLQMKLESKKVSTKP
jgi:Zn-dependent peptidase ImmA (M78 family)